MDAAVGGKVATPLFSAASFESGLQQPLFVGPNYVQLYPIDQTATQPADARGVAFVWAYPPANIDDGDTTTFWAGTTQLPARVRISDTYYKEVTGPSGGKHKELFHAVTTKPGRSAPGVGVVISLSYNAPLTFVAVSMISGDQFPPSSFDKYGHSESQ
jgi:hypothetical protein